SLVGGRIAINLKNTLLFYGILEIGIALFGVVSFSIIQWIGQSLAGSPYVLVFLISFLVLLIPTFLMGMTLPLLTQSFVDRVETSGRVIGVLYGINTLGAAIGCALAGYIFIGFLGLDGTIYIAVLLNAIVGLCAFFLSPWQRTEIIKSESVPTTDISNNVLGYRTILLSSFLVGFLGLGFEILWIRVLMIVNKNTAYSFPSILFIFLLGLAIGGAIWGRKADTSSNPAQLFCKIEMAGAAVAVFTFLGFWISVQGDASWLGNFFETQKPSLPFLRIDREWSFSKMALVANLWSYFLPILILVLPATLVLGGGLTILDRLSINNPLVSGQRVGDIHLANIIGSVAGTFVTSFILLPGIGSEWTLKLFALSTFLFPAFYFLDTRSKPTVQNLSSLMVIGSVLLIGIILLPSRGEFYTRLYAAGSEQEVVVSESGDSVLALTYESRGINEKGLLWIGGEINSFFPPEGLYESRAMVCAGASTPKRILVIGLGGGYITMFFKSIPTVEEIVIVELLEDLSPFLTENQASIRETLADPRITYIVDDGRRYLNAFPDEKFDLISIDPLREHTAGHNNLYSKQALEIYRNHLTENGVLCAWMAERHMIPHSVAQVFPYTDQFANEYMIASNNPIQYDRAYMENASADFDDLAKSIYGSDFAAIPDVEHNLSFFLRDQNQILIEESGTPVLDDSHPLLEYFLFRKPARREITPLPDGQLEFQRRLN
ncbi:MAG TPA: fused MFS/spermidine synthase, partial [Anaerolineales bacterium]|nr:fused MFS/spermidine synthase [Anaerolineales bacterium]